MCLQIQELLAFDQIENVFVNLAQGIESITARPTNSNFPATYQALKDTKMSFGFYF